MPWVSFSLPAGGSFAHRLKDEGNRGSDWLLETDVCGQLAKLTEGQIEDVDVNSESDEDVFRSGGAQ